MKKVRSISMVLAVVMTVCCFAGCGAGSGGGDYIATYNGNKIYTKLFDFFAQFYKDQYVASMGFVDGEVDESEYMTLKHILVNFEKEDGTTRTEEEALAEANKIKAMITAENFDELMLEYSEDPGSESSPEGYTFKHNDGTMVQEFDDGGWALEVGQVSEPVKTSYGYHIIKRVELIKEALPKPIDWNEETQVSETETMSHIESVKERAYDMTVRYAMFSDKGNSEGMTLTDEEYEQAKTSVYSILGTDEQAAEFFKKINYSEDEIKEIVTIITIADRYVDEYVNSLDYAGLFDEFIASDMYKEAKEYYSQMGQEIDYTEYDEENEQLKNMMANFAYEKMYNAELEKTVKNEEAYNLYK